MKSTRLLFGIVFIVSFFLVLLPGSVFAAPTATSAATVNQAQPIDFVRNQIWFSKQPFVGGDQVKVYTSVLNSSAADTRGMVEFYDNQTLIGTTQFSTTAGGSQIVFIRWSATTGDHAFRARITSIRATYPDGSEHSLPDIATGATVSVKVVASTPVVTTPSLSASVGLSGLLRPLDSGPITATSTMSQWVAHGAAVLASTTDSLLDTVRVALQTAKVTNDKKIAQAKIATSNTPKSKSAILASVSGAGQSSLPGPLLLLYSALLQGLIFLFTYKILVYAIALYVLYRIVRAIYRHFSHPAV